MYLIFNFMLIIYILSLPISLPSQIALVKFHALVGNGKRGVIKFLGYVMN